MSDIPENTLKETSYIAGVQFRPAGKIYSFLTDIPNLAVGEPVMVSGEFGASMGYVARAPVEQESENRVLERILGRPAAEDVLVEQERREESLGCFKICADKIRMFNLPMKLVDADLVEGGKKVVFTFFSENRVDFRSLVKELATSLKKRIEMRQVGTRDASKFMGCMGPCGLATCCSTHLRNFQSISIAMAKNQGLSPNPLKLAGMCNKLKCCIFYENDVYTELRKGLPKLQKSIDTAYGKGKIVHIDVLRKLFSVRIDETEKEVVLTLEELEKKKESGCQKKGRHT